MNTKFHMLVITLVFTCCLSAQTSSTTRKQEKKNIDSLLLVTSLPVAVSVEDSIFGKELQLLIEDSLKVRKYDCLDKVTALALYKAKLGEFMGLNNSNRIKEMAEKVSKDKDYFNRENEIAPPYMQGIVLIPCNEETSNCIGIKRQNFPNVRKQRIWEFKQEKTESLYDFVSRIVNAITPGKNNK